MITGKTLRDAIISGANNIANQRTRVDELNVFPVPDGDTGTNMSMTIGAALSELNAMPDTCTVAEASKSAASAMLRGARGNSGVILSLLFRGFSKALKGMEQADGRDFAAALTTGKVDAWVVDNEVAVALAAQQGLTVLDEAMTSEPYAFAFAKGSDELVSSFNASLKKLMDDGSIQEIFDKYGVLYVAPEA